MRMKKKKIKKKGDRAVHIKTDESTRETGSQSLLHGRHQVSAPRGAKHCSRVDFLDILCVLVAWQRIIQTLTATHKLLDWHLDAVHQSTFQLQ